MVSFSNTKKKNGKKIRDYFWGGIMNIHNNKLVYDA